MSQARRLGIVLALNLALVLGLVIVGLLARSVSLLAAAGDCVGDAFSLGLGLLAVHLRDRHGRGGAINLVALINVVVLLAVMAAVLAAAAVRLREGSPPVAGQAVLVAALVTAVVLGAGVVVLGRGAGREDLHMRSVVLDAAADSLAAAGTAVAGLVMAVAQGLYWLDPVVAAVIAVVVAVGAVGLLADVVRALRSGGVVEADLD